MSVNGFRVKVEILKETRSPSRATLDGVQTAVAINSYLTFSIGAGRSIIGIITDLEARESYDPSAGDELSLELLKARRVVAAQLLGTAERTGDTWLFNPGITVLPTLDAPAEVGSPDVMAAVFERPPQKNKPDNYSADDFDHDLVIGSPTGQKSNKVKASYNDLFSRPLAIVGNTGSGKSYSVASILQKAMHNDSLGDSTENAPHVFILDINGEYARAFNVEETQRQPDHIYLNGQEFGIPLWFFNSQEICSWLSASEQTQEPVLKDWWLVAKSGFSNTKANTSNQISTAIKKIDQIIAVLDIIPKNSYSYGKNIKGFCSSLQGYLSNQKGHLTGNYLSESNALKKLVEKCEKLNDWDAPPNDKEIREPAIELQNELKGFLAPSSNDSDELSATSDSPLFIRVADLQNPSFRNRENPEDAGRIDSHLTTLRLRLRTRIDDKRWKSFLNYEKSKTQFSNLAGWLKKFGFQNESSTRVSIIDLSMLSHEALPYACGVIGRILLEARERLPAENRYENPWTLVLEEAHNYARPARQKEEKGQELSRTTFERIAKEGRKFGLSLVVASQRPSEISPTIISQCANFISHRLQNPDDIDHFRRIIPMQARRLLDQVTVLASGEAIVFGSAFHIPMRAQIDAPSPPPYSQTAAPYLEWRKLDSGFPLEDVIENWGLKDASKKR